MYIYFIKIDQRELPYIKETLPPTRRYRLANQKPSSRDGVFVLKILTRGSHSPSNNIGIAPVLGFPSELHGKMLLLKQKQAWKCPKFPKLIKGMATMTQGFLLGSTS